MHSIENEHAPQEETPVEDTVTVSLREYQMMKEALEDMKRKNTAEIKGKTVIERTITPQIGGQTVSSMRDNLLKNLTFDQGNFLVFKNTLTLRLRLANINDNRERLNLLLGCLNMEQQELWSQMTENDREDFDRVLLYFESLYGRKNEISMRKFFNSRQNQESGMEFAMQMQKKATRVRNVCSQQVISAIITGLRPRLANLLPKLDYGDLPQLLEDIERCEFILLERDSVWKRSVGNYAAHFNGRKGPSVNNSWEESLSRKFDLPISLVTKRLKDRCCVKCGKSGHVVKSCNAKVVKVEEIKCVDKNKAQEQVKMINAESIDSDISSKNELLFPILLDKREVIAKLDTGAMISIVEKSVVDPEKINFTKITAQGVGGTRVNILGEATVSIQVGQQRLNAVKVLVVPKLYGKEFLLGLTDYERLGGSFKGKLWNNISLQVENIDVVTDIPSEEDWIRNSISKYYNVNPKKQSKLGPFCIELKDGKSASDITSKPFRLSKQKQKLLDEKLNVLVANGILEQKEGESSSPVFLLKKANGDYRLLCDFRKLNDCTKSVASTIESMEDLMIFAEGKEFFTTVDLSDGFFQVAITDQSQGLTGIVTQNSRYEFRVLPQGAKQSPQLFHNAVRKLLKNIPNAVNYVDDILLCSNNKEEAKEDFISLLKLLSANNLHVKWEKAKILCKEVDFPAFFPY